MFRWCNVCQTFIGQIEPLEDFSLTHGICQECKDKVMKSHFEYEDTLQPIKDFFAKVQKLSFAGETINKRKFLKEAKSLNIKASDLLAGILQPLLYEIGRLYSLDQMDIITEHKFSQFVTELITDIRSEFLDQSSYPENARVDVILSCANGNNHAFGVTFLELCLREAGVSVEAIYPGVPADQLADYVQFMNPKVLGVSMSMREQLPEIKYVAKLLSGQETTNPYFLVGGFGVTKEMPAIDGVHFFNGNIRELVGFIKKKTLKAA